VLTAEKKQNTKTFYWQQTHIDGHSTHNLIMDNKGHKNKSIIVLLLFGRRIGKDIPLAMTLNNNKIDYVY